MARVTDDMVREIMEVDPTITSYTPFITVASSIVDKIAIKDATIQESELTEIERWLSAHFVAIRDMRSDSEKAGSVSVKYQYKLEIGFDVTLYGQMAKRLDISGYLAKLDQDAKNGGPITPELESW
jgi:hypothetical protein